MLFIPLCRFKSASGIIFLFPEIFFNVPSSADLPVENFLEHMFIWNLTLPGRYLCYGLRVLASREHCASLQFGMRMDTGAL